VCSHRRQLGVGPPYLVNPGYFSQRAEHDLFDVSLDGRWNELTRTQRIIGWQLVGTHRLPPDWARVGTARGAIPSGPASGGYAQYGLDAARFPVLMAELRSRRSGTGRGAAPHIERAHRLPWGAPPRRHARRAMATSDLDGGASSRRQSRWDDSGALRRRDGAAAIERRYPTYFGAAWVALRWCRRHTHGNLGRAMSLTRLDTGDRCAGRGGRGGPATRRWRFVGLPPITASSWLPTAFRRPRRRRCRPARTRRRGWPR
jgi:hypothetical protein